MMQTNQRTSARCSGARPVLDRFEAARHPLGRHGVGLRDMLDNAARASTAGK
jgi:hypothetical protein